MEFLPHILRAKSFTSLPCLIIIALLGFASASSAFPIAPYLPNTAGSQWSYDSTGYHTMTHTIGSQVTLPGVGLVTPWTDIESGEYGYDTTYVTVGGNGILVHQEYSSKVYVSGYGYTSVTSIYSPAMAIAPADVTVGATYTASGTVTTTYANVSTATWSCIITTNIVGFETVSNKSGTQSWPALKVIMSMTISGANPGFNNGQFFTRTSAETLWMVDGLGIVQKSSPDDYGAMETWKLTSTNVSITAIAPSSISVPASDSDGSYLVSWETSGTPGASYTLEEATNSTFTTALQSVYTGTNTSVNLNERLSGTTYYYRVKATKSGYTESVWIAGNNGCLVTLTVGVPMSLSVPTSDTDGNFSVSWGASTTSGVTYVLQESTDPSFISNLRNVYSGSDTIANITGRLTDNTFYYRVKATKQGYTDSAWTSNTIGIPVSFPVNAPASIAVPASDADGIFIVSWGASSTGNTTYLLEEATNVTFTTGLRAAYSGTDLSANISDRSTATTYYYRVKAVKTGYTDSAFTKGANGCIVTLFAGTPTTITAPTTDADGNYTVSWTASPTPGASYSLVEATNSSFTTGVRNIYNGTGLTTNISGRTTGSTYYYRVKAIMPGYTDSIWATAANGCVVTIPATPAIINIPSIGTDSSYAISWTASDTAGVNYTLQEATSNGFTNGLQTAYIGTSTSVILEGRKTGTTYYYRVKATKSGYPDSAWTTGTNGCLIQFPKGDANSDGLVRMHDAVLILKALTGISPTSPIAIDADTDGDHKLSISDALFILRQIAAGR